MVGFAGNCLQNAVSYSIMMRYFAIAWYNLQYADVAELVDALA